MKRFTLPVLVCFLLFFVLPSIAYDSDFVIDHKGILLDYLGNEENLVVPDGITGIGSMAFYGDSFLKTVTLPASLISIGDRAFENCANLTFVNIPDNVTEIGSKAFFGCKSLKSVTIPDGVSYVRDRAFAGSGLITVNIIGSISYGYELAFADCASLESVSFGYGITYLYWNMFSNCTSLSEVNLPESLESISSQVFMNCENLKSITIPENVSFISDWAFEGTDITITANEGSYAAKWAARNNIKLNLLPNDYQSDFVIDSDGVLKNYLGSDEKVVIPEGVTAIGTSAFSYSGFLKQVILPDGIESIGDNAFEKCENLELINIPQSVKTIGSFSFSGCNKLEKVNFPDGLTDIGFASFENTGLKSVQIPGSVQKIGFNAFENCANLRKVTIAYGVESLNGETFNNCINLIEVTLPESLQRFWNPQDFGNCTSLKEIRLPDSLVYLNPEVFTGTDVTVYVKEDSYAAKWAMQNNVKYHLLPSDNPSDSDFVIDTYGVLIDYKGRNEIVEIPDGVKKIGDYAFSGNNYIKQVIMPDGLWDIGMGAFQNCENLAIVDLPKSLFQIQSYSFSGCNQLKNIRLLEETYIIGDEAFAETGLISISFPSSLYYLYSGAFRNCSNLKSVSFAEDIEMENFYGLTFENCTSLTEVNIPNSVTKFWNPGDFKNCTSLKKITIPETITEMADGVFEGTDVTIYAVEGSYAAKWAAANNVKLHLTERPKPAYSPFQIDNDGMLTSYNGRDEVVEIPFGVKSIKYQAFKDNSYIRKVIIPDSVTAVGWGAFENCANLENVVLSSNMTVIDEYTFEDCRNLTSITIPQNVTTIGYSAFENCSSLTGFTLPDSVTSIGAKAFTGCTMLSWVNLSNRLVSIGYEAFMDCVSLRNITIPDTVTTIGWSAFQGCNVLWTVNLPKKLQKIERSTFSGCTALREITIPNTVVKIESYAFYNCSNLLQIAIPFSVKSIAEYSFAYCEKLEMMIIPDTLMQIEANAIWIYWDHPLIIRTTAGSWVADWAIENGHPVQYASSNEFIVPAEDIRIFDEYMMSACGNDCDYFNHWLYGTSINIGTAGTEQEKITMQLYSFVSPEQASKRVKWSSSDTSVAVVNSVGLVTGLKPGTTTITVSTYENPEINYSIELNVYSIIQPESIMILGMDEVAVKRSIKLEASFDQTVQPTYKDVTWSSLDPEIVSVSDSGTVTGVAEGIATIQVCSKEKINICDEKDITVLPYSGPDVQEFSIWWMDENGEYVNDTEITLDAVTGQTLAIFAFDETGEISDVTWTNSNPSVLSLKDGVISGLKVGTSKITASKKDGNKTVSASLTVHVAAKVQPDSLVINGADEVMQKKTTKLSVSFNQAVQPTNKLVNWSSLNPEIASVNNSGVVTGIAEGVAVIQACSQENAAICAEKNITVLPYYGPDAKEFSIWWLDENGEFVNDKTVTLDLAAGKPLTFYAYDAEGEVTDATWKNSAPKVAVFNKGTLTGVKTGTTKLTVSHKEGTKTVSAAVTVKVAAKVQPGSIVITGADEVAVKKNTKLALTFDQDIQPTNKKVTWTSSDSTIAKVSASGVVAGVSMGDAVITACSSEDRDICGEHYVHVTPVAVNVEIFDVEDSNYVIDLAGAKKTIQLGAEITPEQAAQSVTWKSNSTAIADVDENGLVTAKKAGTVTITATAADGSKKSAKVKINIGIMPQAGSLVVSGPAEVAEKKSIKLTAVFDQEAKPTNSKIIWSSSDVKIAKVSAAGAVTGVSGGTAVITACSAADDRVCAEHPVTVLPLVKAVIISDEEGNDLVIDQAVGMTSYQLGASTEPAGAAQSVTWKSSSAAIAEVDENGRVTAKKTGTVTITAKAVDGSNKSASVKLTIKAKVQPDSLKIKGERSRNIMPKAKITLMTMFDQAVQPTVSKIVWSSSDIKVAKVSPSGIVTAVKEGTAVIRAAAKDDVSVYDEIEIIVGGLLNSESLIADAGQPDDTGTDTPEETVEGEGIAEPDESKTNTEETVTAEAEGPRFALEETILHAGESLILEVLNPGEEAVMIGLSGDTDAVLWDEEQRMLTAVGEAEVTAFLSTIDPVEVRDILVIHIVSELAEEEEVTEETGEGEGAVTDDSEDVIAETEEPAADENTAKVTEPDEGDETVETVEPAEGEENADAVSEGEPDEGEETDKPADEGPVEISIRDLEDNGGLSGEANGVVVIERERFELDDETLTGLVFEIEDESVAKLTTQSVEELLVNGIEIRLLAEGETRLVIKQKGEEEPLRAIRLVVTAAPAVEEPAEEELSAIDSVEPETVSEPVENQAAAESGEETIVDFSLPEAEAEAAGEEIPAEVSEAEEEPAAE